MTAKPAPRQGWEAFARPASVNQRRYEAVRAYVLEGAPLGEAAARFGYSRVGAGVAGPRLPGREAGAVRRAGQARPQERAEEGRRPRPGDRAAPGQGLSVYEISARLAAEGTPLNRTGVGQILAEEGFGRLLRHPEPEASISPATRRAGHEPAPRQGHRLRRVPRHGQHPARRAAARRPRPGRPRPARPGPQGRLPRHPRHPRGVVAAVPAGPQAHRHPAGLPRRRPARRPGQRPVRRAGDPAEEVRAHQLLLPAVPRPPARASWPPSTPR